MSRILRPLTVAGAVTLQDPNGKQHRLVGEGSKILLDLHSLRSIVALAQVAPRRKVREAAMARLCQALAAVDLTLDIRLWRRTAAQLRPGGRGGLVGRLFGISGLKLTPLLFLRREP